MIVKFNNEQNLKGFISTTSAATKISDQPLLALVWCQSKSDDEIFRKLNTEKSIVNKTFADKYHNSETPFYVTGDILLKTKEGISAESILDKFKIDGQIVKRWLSGGVVIRLNNWDNIMDIANAIYESGMVEWCHPDFATIIECTTSDPMFNQQYYLKNTGINGGKSGIDINVEPAWSITTGSNIRVAVIDDGVENHEDLNGRVLQGFTPLNPNGFGVPTTQNVPGVTIGHGQACAGIIAASHNTIGIAGVAPNAQIVPVNIFHTWLFDPYQNKWVNTETTQNVADAIEFAWDPNRGNADVISNSWGFRSTTINQVDADAIRSAINTAMTNGRGGLGSVVVFASGNSNQDFSGVTFPANVNGVIAVGAINRNGTVWNYSSRGDALSVVTPSGNTDLSGDVATTDRMGTSGYETGNYTTRFGGTSAACPQVAGVAALILSFRPDLRQDQVRQAIESNCTKLPGYSYSTNSSHPNGTWSTDVGYGLVNAYAAVHSVIPTITGPSEFCYGQTGTYSVSNAPAGFTWGKSSNLTITGSGNSVSVSATSAGTGWLSINSGTTELVRYNVTVPSAAPVFNYISGPEYVTPGSSTYSYYTSFSGGIPSVYEWTIAGAPSNYYTYYAYNGSLDICFFQEASYDFYVAASNACGCGIGHLYVYAYYKQNYNFYPNPASSVLNIDIDQETVEKRAQAQAIQQNTANIKSVKTEPVYDIRLYNHHGHLLRHATSHGSRVQLNVAHLHNGIYYLHIYNGISEKPEIHQIMVKH